MSNYIPGDRESGADNPLSTGIAAINAALQEQESEEAPQITLEQLRVDTTTPIPDPHYKLKMNGSELLGAGNLCVVCGQPKCGKSQLLNVIVAVLLSGRPFGSMGRGDTPVNHIVWLETEQSNYDIRTNLQRLFHHAGIPEGADIDKYGLHVYSMRRVTSCEERMRLMYEAVSLHNPELLVIDGIADLAVNFNDEREALDISSGLLALLDAMPMLTVVGVIHTNYGTDKMKGHLGTMLYQRLGERLDCKKENGVFCVSNEHRHKPMTDNFRFSIDSNGWWVPADADEAAGIMQPDALREAVGDGCKWAELVANYKRIAKCTPRTAEQILRSFHSKGTIYCDTDRNYHIHI